MLNQKPTRNTQIRLLRLQLMPAIRAILFGSFLNRAAPADGAGEAAGDDAGGDRDNADSCQAYDRRKKRPTGTNSRAHRSFSSTQRTVPVCSVMGFYQDALLHGFAGKGALTAGRRRLRRTAFSIDPETL